MKTTLALLWLPALLACATHSTDPRELTWAPALGVDLAQMTVTPGGLYTQDMVQGTGAEARPGSIVRVLYSGWLPDGRPFDSALDRAAPVEFRLGAGEVIRGWEEGLRGMRAGGLRRLVVPPRLAYGSQSVAGVPPYSTLLFEIELVGVR